MTARVVDLVIRKGETFSYTLPPFTDGLKGRRYAIDDVTPASKKWEIAGDVSDDFAAGDEIVVDGNAAAVDGDYTVDTVTFADPNTEIVVEEVVNAAATNFGTLTRAENRAIDIRLYQLDAQIWDERGGTVLEDFTVAAVDDASGRATISLTAAQTAALDFTRGVWGLRINSPTNVVSFLFEGSIIALSPIVED